MFHAGINYMEHCITKPTFLVSLARAYQRELRTSTKRLFFKDVDLHVDAIGFGRSVGCLQRTCNCPEVVVCLLRRIFFFCFLLESYKGGYLVKSLDMSVN